MTFQFLCPQGHLLQGEESQAGQQSMCPYCQSLFIIPFPQGVAPGGVPPGQTQGVGLPGPGIGVYGGGGVGPSGPTGADSPGSWPTFAPSPEPMQGSFPTPSPPPQEAFPPYFSQGQSPFAQEQSPGQVFGGSASQASAEPENPAISFSPTGVIPSEASFLHILCPSGHELETPRDMLGQEAICPYCQVQFRLRWEDSLECRRERELEQERRLARQSKLWMQWSIAAAVAVIGGVIVLIAIAASR